MANAFVSVTDWIEKLAGRCDVLHVNDRAVKFGTNKSFITECGTGNVDIAGAIKAAEASGVKSICIEQDTWPLGFDSLDYSAKKNFEHVASLLK